MVPGMFSVVRELLGEGVSGRVPLSAVVEASARVVGGGPAPTGTVVDLVRVLVGQGLSVPGDLVGDVHVPWPGDVDTWVAEVRARALGAARADTCWFAITDEGRRWLVEGPDRPSAVDGDAVVRALEVVEEPMPLEVRVFLEWVTFAGREELETLLDDAAGAAGAELPGWARALARRLLDLQPAGAVGPVVTPGRPGGGSSSP